LSDHIQHSFLLEPHAARPVKQILLQLLKIEVPTIYCFLRKFGEGSGDNLVNPAILAQVFMNRIDSTAIKIHAASSRCHLLYQSINKALIVQRFYPVQIP
jgi:hypothetical protein